MGPSATTYLASLVPNAYTILAVGQPVQTGPGGIWVIVSATQHRS